MSLVFARVYCKLKSGDSRRDLMAKANTCDNARDALAWYDEEFAAVDMSNEVSGINTLRHLFVLLIGLGMRESSGRYCEGRDKSASNTTAETAEAGLFQTSFNARTGSPRASRSYLLGIRPSPSGFVETFRDGIRCTPSRLEELWVRSRRGISALSKALQRLRPSSLL